jgi:hypothetical protein
MTCDHSFFVIYDGTFAKVLIKAKLIQGFRPCEPARLF